MMDRMDKMDKMDKMGKMDKDERNVYLEDIPMEEARAHLADAMTRVGRGGPLPGEDVPLREAVGRVTAGPVWAKLSSPHYHAAAMDGYAVRAADTIEATETRPVTLTLGEQAHPVDTGAPLPPDTNAVIMIEHVQHLDEGGDERGEGGEAIEIRAPVTPWRHVRPMGEDIVATELILPENHRLRPVDLGAVAGCGYHTVSVRRRPRVVLIPTGSELVAADRSPRPGQVIEYNSLVLSAQIEAIGGTAAVLDITPDKPEQLRAALEQAVARQPDMILVLSGSSAGSRDYTAALVREMGELLVHGVAVRPGHPVIMGMVQDIPLVGVPGYPVSAALTGELFIEPVLARWLGVPAPIDTRPRIHATMTRKLISPIGDDDFVRVTVAQVGERLLATPLQRGAGVITSLLRADGLAHIPRFSEGVDMGQAVPVILYRAADELAKAILAMGSHDPMLDLLAQHLALHAPGSRLTSANVGSMGGLVALRRKEAHLAGMHLLDEASGAYNVPYIQKQLPDEPLQLVTFAHREQGLIVAKGNPEAIESLDDLTRVRYVNRQRGAGTRLLLDYELKQRGIAPERVEGYTREEYTHLTVAAAVASGVADAGLGVRSAALALDLDFIPVGWERYDLAIPKAHLDHVQAVLDVIRDDGFRQALAAQPGYDTRETGIIHYEQ